MTSILGRMATYSGKVVEWKDAINSQINPARGLRMWDAMPKSLPGPDGNDSRSGQNGGGLNTFYLTKKAAGTYRCLFLRHGITLPKENLVGSFGRELLKHTH